MLLLSVGITNIQNFNDLNAFSMGKIELGAPEYPVFIIKLNYND